MNSMITLSSLYAEYVTLRVISCTESELLDRSIQLRSIQKQLYSINISTAIQVVITSTILCGQREEFTTNEERNYKRGCQYHWF